MEALGGCCRTMQVVLSQVVVTVVIAVLLAGCQASPTLEYHVFEEAGNQSLVGNVARDAKLHDKFPDQQHSSLRFSFLEQPNSHAALFHVEEYTGIIRTQQRVDRDALCPLKLDCQVTLDVAVLGPAQYFEMISVIVHIKDINDNSPKFSDKVVKHNVSESALVGTSIGLPIADDPDSGMNGIQRYELIRGAGVFELKETFTPDGSSDLRLVLKKKLDREVADSYRLEVAAYDGGSPSKSGSVLINISVSDANDNGPVFNNDTYIISIREDSPINHTLLEVKALDSDVGINAKLRYSFSTRTQMNNGDLFGIATATGQIFLKKALDFEEAKRYHLVVVAQDSGPESKAAQATVMVSVLDVNDNAPSIKVNTLTTSGEAQISEGAENGTFVAHISAVDYDSGPSGEFSCRLDGMGFRLEQLSLKTQYKIVTAAVLDREAISQFEVVLSCKDKGIPPLTASQTLTINVLDENDHSPKFSQSTFYTNLLENNKVDAFLIQVHAFDEDDGQNAELDFSIQDDPEGFFKIHQTLGIIRAAVPLDYENARELRFTVTATDLGVPRRSAMSSVVVTITDINDEPPLFSRPEYSFGVYENEDPDTGVGLVVATDADSNPEYAVIEYSIIGPDSVLDTFMIDSDTGDISTMKVLDREETAQYVMTVEARNPGVPHMSSSATVTVYVADENDNSPIVEFPVLLNNTVHVFNHVPVGHTITRIRATDYDTGENSKLQFSVVDEDGSSLFDVDSATGALRTSQILGGIEGMFPVKVLVEDSGNPPKLAWANLNVIVNKSMIYANEMTSSGGSSNKTIMISLAVASLVIILVLVIAIACLKFHDRRDKRRGSSYMCRTEAQKMLHGLKEFPDSQDGPNGAGVPPGSQRGTIKQLSFAGQNEDPPAPPQLKEYALADDPEPINRSFPDSGISGTSSQNSQICPTYTEAVSSHGVRPSETQAPVMVYMATVPEGSTPSLGETSRSVYLPHSSTQTYPHSHKVTPADRELEVQRYLKLLHGDPDSESACSNTDSGRGPSEEGELSHTGHLHLDENYLEHNRDLRPCDCDSQSPCQPACPHTAARQPADSLLPCHSMVAYGNQHHRGDSIKHRHLSGLSDGPIKTSSPHSKSGYYGNNTEELPVRSILKNNNHRPYRQPLAPSPRGKPITFTGAGHPGVHYSGHSRPLGSERDCHYSNQRNGYHSIMGQNVPTGALAEDNESVLSYDQRTNCADIPDDATTTSGSYVVDVDDLAQDLGDAGIRDTDV